MPDTLDLLGTLVVHPWLCDQFGHLNTRHYAGAFDDAILVFWTRLGATSGKVHPVTAEMKTSFRSEARAGQVAELHGSCQRIGGKSVNLAITLTDLSAGEELARCEIAEVFFDSETRQSAPIPDHVRTALAAQMAD